MQSNLLEFVTIDRRSRVPFDQQIKESIKALILDQSFYYKTKLPNPAMLGMHLNVSEKITTTAYNQLEFERYIKKNANKEYTVSYFELTNYFFDRNVAIYDAIIALGLTPSIECVQKKVVTLDEETIISMGFDPNKKNKYFYINRLYLGDQKPIIIMENYLPLYIFPDIDVHFQGHEPLNAYIDEHYGIIANISQRRMKAVNLPAKIGSYLNERKNVASIQSTNHIYDKKNRLIDYGRSHTISSYYFQALISKSEMAEYMTQFSLENTRNNVQKDNNIDS